MGIAQIAIVFQDENLRNCLAFSLWQCTGNFIFGTTKIGKHRKNCETALSPCIPDILDKVWLNYPTHLLFPFPFQKFQARQDPEEANQDLEEVKDLDEAQDLEEIQDLDKVEHLEEVEDLVEVEDRH